MMFVQSVVAVEYGIQEIHHYLGEIVDADETLNDLADAFTTDAEVDFLFTTLLEEIGEEVSTYVEKRLGRHNLAGPIERFYLENIDETAGYFAC